MTESDWQKCTDPTPMLEILHEKASDRKLRLFAVAACWHSLQCFGHYDLDEGVDWAEKYADGTAMDEPSEEITGTIQWATGEMCESLNCLGEAVSNIISPSVIDCHQASQTAKAIVEAHQIADVDSSADTEASKQSDFLRDLFGNHFRPIIRVYHSWLTPTVTDLATAAYEERALPSRALDAARLAVLSDALEEAGCDNADILDHLRGPGPHVRGCWVLDLLLGKE